MDNNNFLSFPRIAMVMKREIMENWKTNIFRFIGLYAAFASVMIGNMWGVSHDNVSADPDMYFNQYCTVIMGAFAFIIGIISLVYAANIMENMIKKRETDLFPDASGYHDREVCGPLPACYDRLCTGGSSCCFIG